jgi:NADH dehydrogenase [ubiquinone] 1 alpha subcomplex assembly factor 2
MVKYKDAKVHLADVNVPPQWMQWLRHTRSMAPTVEEQRVDVFRQQHLKQLAAAADARWAAQDSFLVAPDPLRQERQSKNQEMWTSVGGSNTRLDEAARKMGILDESEQRPLRPESRAAGQTVKLDSEISSKPSPWDEAPKPKDEPDAWKPKAVQR